MSNVVTLDQNSNTGSDVLARVKALLEQSTVTQAQIAKEIGVSGSTVNQLLNGNYKADPTAMVQKLANWLTARDQRADAPRDPGFVMTETAKQIMADMGYALTTQSIVIIHGISGVGKTTALLSAIRNRKHQPHSLKDDGSPTPARPTPSSAPDPFSKLWGARSCIAAAMEPDRQQKSATT